MKIAIVGSRTFEDYRFLEREMLELYVIRDIEEIISGGAKGADFCAKRFAAKYRIPYTEFPADWETYGKSAGFIRNQLIVDRADIVVAFWDGSSRGTEDTLKKAKNAGKQCVVFLSEDCK